jgi:hypothetical protein
MLPLQRTIQCKPHEVYRKTQFFKWQGYECTHLRWVNQYRVTMIFNMVHAQNNRIKSLGVTYDCPFNR